MRRRRARGTPAAPSNRRFHLISFALVLLLADPAFAVSVGPAAVITLSSPNSQNYGEFGYSVAASGNIVVVGAPQESVGRYTYAGRAYIFNSETGALITTLTSPNSQNYGEFGYSVAISGNTVVAGGDGNAYIFVSETGSLVATLTSPNSQDSVGASYSFAISGSAAIAGAPFENVGEYTNAGRANITDAETDAVMATLTSPNSQNYGEFGYSVAVSGNVSVVGAPGETIGSNLDAGRTYVFNSKNGALVFTLTSPDSQYDGNFGYSAAASGNTAVVGAPGEGVGGSVFAGRVYIFNLASTTSELPSSTTSIVGSNSNSVHAAEVVLAVAAIVAGGLVFVTSRVKQKNRQPRETRKRCENRSKNSRGRKTSFEKELQQI